MEFVMGGKRIYDVKEDYFETWSHEMAYILGFISADGSINKEKTSLAIELQMRDKEVLEFIQRQISPTAPIKTTKKKEREYCRLRINSKKLIQSLRKYNVVPNKTFTIRIDFDIPKEFLGDYVRGLFDGDGWITCRRNTIEFGICSGSNQFLDDIKHKIKYGRVRVKHKGKFITYILDAEANSAIAIRDLMYASGGFALQRKKTIFYSNFYTPSPRWWTKEQVQYLKEHYGEPLQTVADALGKSYKATSKKIWKLKLTSY
jgi:LAGLIDADG-like domain/WhiA LAGLIDADG-like domain